MNVVTKNSTLSIICMGVVIILLRLNGLNSLYDGSLIWAEDGSIFINQAYSMGLSSITTVYAGYIHLYPRIVAYISVFLPVSLIPFIFSLAWLVVYIFMLYQIIDFYKTCKKNNIIILVIVVLVGLISHQGESFFNITNAQFFLAIGSILFLSD